MKRYNVILFVFFINLLFILTVSPKVYANIIDISMIGDKDGFKIGAISGQ